MPPPEQFPPPIVPGRSLRSPIVPDVWRVRNKTVESADTVTLAVAPASGAPPPFLPGQFHMLYAFAVGEAAISLSGDPASKDERLHTVRAVGAVSRALVALQKGDSLGVRGPYGAPWPLATAEGHDLVFVAGGIGLAPLRPAILAALAERAKFGRIAVLYGARTPDERIFREELSRWEREGALDLHVTVDRADAGWRGHVGLVTRPLAVLELEPARTSAFLCGPEIMMRLGAEALAERGVPAAQVHVSMERNMKCAVGHCGHCQLGADFVCKDGPVFPWTRMAPVMTVREL